MAANGFDHVTGHAGAGGTDTANLYDSAGNDAFSAWPTTATFSGTGFANTAASFGRVNAYASAGNDVADLYDSSGNDTFYGLPTSGYLTGAGFLNYANGFDHVTGHAGAGGTDTALPLRLGPGRLLQWCRKRGHADTRVGDHVGYRQFRRGPPVWNAGGQRHDSTERYHVRPHPDRDLGPGLSEREGRRSMKCPRQESNLAFDLRRVACSPSHSEDNNVEVAVCDRSKPSVAIERSGGAAPFQTLAGH